MWEVVKASLDLIAPRACPTCQRTIKGGWLCTTCTPPFIDHTKRCNSCDTWVDERCKECASSPLPYHSIRYLCDFQSRARVLVHKMKYALDEKLCRLVGVAMGRELVPLFAERDWELIVPVPSSRSALRRRLYNQTLSIARGVKRGSRSDAKIVTSALRHRGYPSPQAKLPTGERLENVRQAFSATRLAQGRRILLVEDVVTTGATTAAAAAALLAAGALRVDVIAFARVERWNSFRARIAAVFPSPRTERIDMSEVGEKFTKLVEIIATLRDPKDGCPWDLEQTHESLRKYVIEEAYEVVDAIDNDISTLPKELGDLLLQVVLHAQVGADSGTFAISDVIAHISEKLVRRHPHVFGTERAGTASEVAKSWEKIKAEENTDKSIISGVPARMPALLRAQRISEKAARAGFEWPTLEGIRDQILDEVREFVEESISPNADPLKVKDEFGDILFSLIQLARRLNFDAEEALHASSDKFSRRFRRMEELAQPKQIPDLTLEELDGLWKSVKREPGMDR